MLKIYVCAPSFATLREAAGNIFNLLFFKDVIASLKWSIQSCGDFFPMHFHLVLLYIHPLHWILLRAEEHRFIS